jgi:tRNA U38,U39,U40 pseudouridine synthase TruA
MVRTAAAFIVACGEGKMSPSDLDGILEGKRRRPAPLPPEGLYLWKVKYR